VTAPAKGDSCTAGDLVTDTTVKLCIDGNVDHLVPLSINTDNEYFIQASLLNTKLASDKYYVITIGENIVEPKTLTNDDKKLIKFIHSIIDSLDSTSNIISFFSKHK